MSSYRFAKLFEVDDHQVLYTMLPVEDQTQLVYEDDPYGERELVQLKIVCRVDDGAGQIQTHEHTEVMAAWRAEQQFDEIDDVCAQRDLERAAHFFNPDECEV